MNEMQMFRNIKISFAVSTQAGKKANGLTNSVFYLFCLLRGFRDKNTKKIIKDWINVHFFSAKVPSLIVEWKIPLPLTKSRVV